MGGFSTSGSSGGDGATSASSVVFGGDDIIFGRVQRAQGLLLLNGCAGDGVGELIRWQTRHSEECVLRLVSRLKMAAAAATSFAGSGYVPMGSSEARATKKTVGFGLVWAG
jgi:hypothetical protein